MNDCLLMRGEKEEAVSAVDILQDKLYFSLDDGHRNCLFLYPLLLLRWFENNCFLSQTKYSHSTCLFGCDVTQINKLNVFRFLWYLLTVFFGSSTPLRITLLMHNLIPQLVFDSNLWPPLQPCHAYSQLLTKIHFAKSNLYFVCNFCDILNSLDICTVITQKLSQIGKQEPGCFSHHREMCFSCVCFIILIFSVDSYNWKSTFGQNKFCCITFQQTTVWLQKWVKHFVNLMWNCLYDFGSLKYEIIFIFLFIITQFQSSLN